MRAMIIIDLQNDFVPGGALPVPYGDDVIPLANDLIPKFDLVVAAQDWHPRNHTSFAANHPGRKAGDVIEVEGLRQTLWPIHAVQNTRGAELVPELNRRHIQRVFYKATDPLLDSYSCFFDNGHRRATGMAEFLKGQSVHEVWLLGLATDYGVRFSALDGLNLGLRMHVIEDACRGINLQPGDSHRAIEEMRGAGVIITNSQSILREMAA